MGKNITRVKWEASGLPFGVSFDERTGTFSGEPEDVGTHTIPVTVTTNYGTDTKDVFLRVEKRTHPLYVIGANAEVRSNGAEADSEGWRICKIPEGERIINMSLGFIIKTEAGTYVCGRVDLTREELLQYPYPRVLHNYTVPTLREDLQDIERAVNGYVYIYKNRNNPNNLTSTSYHYFMGMDKYGTFISVRSQTVYTDDKGKEYPGSHEMPNGGRLDTSYSEDSFREIYPEQYGCITRVFQKVTSTYNTNIISITNNIQSNYTIMIPESTIIKKALSPFVGANLVEYGILLTDSGNLLNIYGGTKVETGIENIKNIWSDYNASFIQDGKNNLYVCGTFAGNTYSEFTEIGNFDVKKLLQAGNAAVILTNDGKLYYAGQCASIPAMAVLVNTFTQIYPQYSFYDVHLETTDMAALCEIRR